MVLFLCLPSVWDFCVNGSYIQMTTRVGQQAAINSNVSHFCWPGKFTHSHIKRINPDKNTFLNSNLLLSNILNRLPPNAAPTTLQQDAYLAKDEELQRVRVMQAERKEKIDRVKNHAKARTQSAQEQRRSQEKEVLKQVEQIQIMRIEMGQKARDIMSRKEDTAYLGRNLFLQGEKFLKGMREANPSEKTLKTEATRMLMKECAKQKGKTLPRPDPSFSQEHSETAPIPSSSSSNNNNNISVNASMEASMETHQKLARTAESARELGLARMIRNNSFQSVLQEQKRQAAWRGFADNWAMGFYKNEDVITTRKKRRNKRSPRKFMNVTEISSSNLLDYNDLASRHASLKKYKQHFDTTASAYTLLSP